MAEDVLGEPGNGALPALPEPRSFDTMIESCGNLRRITSGLVTTGGVIRSCKAWRPERREPENAS